MLVQPHKSKQKASKTAILAKVDAKLAEIVSIMQQEDLYRVKCLYHEIANLYFDIDEWELGMKYIDEESQFEKKIDQINQIKGGYKRHLKDLQEKVQEACKNGDLEKAKNLLKQMLAIATNIGNETLIKNYRENLKKVAGMQKKTTQ